MLGLAHSSTFVVYQVVNQYKEEASKVKIETFLQHFGITIQDERLYRPKSTFNSTNHDSQFQGKYKSTLWLPVDKDFAESLTSKMKVLYRRESPEIEYTMLVYEHLLKREAFPCLQKNDRREYYWLAERLLGFPNVIDDILHSNWKSPPQLVEEENTKRAAESIFARPADCSYWLSAKGFDYEYRDAVYLAAAVFCYSFGDDDGVTCPYLSVAFNNHSGGAYNDEEYGLRDPVHRVAIAGARALYNRWCLRNDRLQEQELAWAPTDWACLKHFCITFDREYFKMWRLQPPAEAISGQRWIGCVMVPVDHGILTRPGNVLSFCDTLNQFHLWGLTVHASSVDADVKSLLFALDDFRRYHPVVAKDREV